MKYFLPVSSRLILPLPTDLNLLHGEWGEFSTYTLDCEPLRNVLVLVKIASNYSESNLGALPRDHLKRSDGGARFDILFDQYFFV